MTQLRQKFAVLSTRSPCFSATSKTFFHHKIFLLSICRSKDSREKGNITDSQFDYCAKIKFIKYHQQVNIIENTWIYSNYFSSTKAMWDARPHWRPPPIVRRVKAACPRQNDLFWIHIDDLRGGCWRKGFIYVNCDDGFHDLADDWKWADWFAVKGIPFLHLFMRCWLISTQMEEKHW